MSGQVDWTDRVKEGGRVRKKESTKRAGEREIKRERVKAGGRVSKKESRGQRESKREDRKKETPGGGEKEREAGPLRGQAMCRH